MNNPSDKDSGAGAPFLKETESLRDLRALEAIERNPHVSQRELASSMGVALGIANACVHTLVRKGLVKIRGENNRSITYHVTKRGFTHKSALAMQWTMNTIGFYREARLRVAATLQGLADSGARRVLLWGESELAEIVCVAAPLAGVEVVGLVGEADTYLSQVLSDVPIGGPELVFSTKPDVIAVTAMIPAEEVAALRKRIAEDTGFGRVVGVFEGEVREEAS